MDQFNEGPSIEKLTWRKQKQSCLDNFEIPYLFQIFHGSKHIKDTPDFVYHSA